MKEIRELPSRAFYLGKVELPHWAGREYFIYTDGKRYYFLEEVSYAEWRVLRTYYKTTSLNKIKRYIQEVASAIGLRVEFEKTEAFCDSYLFFRLTNA